MTVDITLNRYPQHLRGFVHSRRQRNEWSDTGWITCRYWGVINVDTGEVIAKDNTGCSLSDAIDRCAVMVLAARGAWMWGLTQKQLKRNEGQKQSWESMRKRLLKQSAE